MILSPIRGYHFFGHEISPFRFHGIPSAYIFMKEYSYLCGFLEYFACRYFYIWTSEVKTQTRDKNYTLSLPTTRDWITGSREEQGACINYSFMLIFIRKNLLREKNFMLCRCLDP